MRPADFALAFAPSLLSLACVLAFRVLPLRAAAALSSLLAAAAVAGCALALDPAALIPLAANAAGSGTFLAYYALSSRKLRRFWRERTARHEKEDEGLTEKRKALKLEMDRLEKQMVQSVKVYGAVKGLGEALTWQEMIPHIEYAVLQCMGFKDYQLFLLDEDDKFQRVLFRGARLNDFPFHQAAPALRRHEKHGDVYSEIPIAHGETRIAVLWARNPAPGDSDLKLLAEAAQLSEELAMGLQKARFFSALERLSRTDGLTGLNRRQVFNDRLNEEVRRYRVFKTVFSLLIADVDHFKAINDTYGHQAGDEVLRKVGQTLKESVYETDFVARYGGEEFVILFPQADPKGVWKKAEAVRHKIESEVFELGWNKIRVTMSFGIAHFPGDGAEPAALLDTADRALYMAKETGRNRVVDSSHLR